MNDAQRQKLYNAEMDCGNGLFYLSIEEAQREVVDWALKRKWWKDKSPIAAIELRAIRGRYATACPDFRRPAVIGIPPGTLCTTYIKHEMAHYMAHTWDHGREFADALLYIYRHMGDAYQAKRLKDAFDRHGVEYSPRR